MDILLRFLASKGIPLWAVKLGLGLILAAGLSAGYLAWAHHQQGIGASRVQAKWDAERQEKEIDALESANHQAQATIEEVTKYVDRIQIVQGKTKTIIKEVPAYVPAQADADCIINTGFVRLHDSDAANTIPNAPGTADAAPSGVALSTVAETIAENYGACHENAEQLTALQRWITAMAAAGDKK